MLISSESSVYRVIIMMLRLGVNEVIVSYNLLAAKEGVGALKSTFRSIWAHAQRCVGEGLAAACRVDVSANRLL